MAELLEVSFSGWRESVSAFLKQVSIETLVVLSPVYESHDRLKEVSRDTKMRTEELLKIEPDLPKALERFSDEQAVRFMTMRKSKGLEFDSVSYSASRTRPSGERQTKSVAFSLLAYHAPSVDW